MPIALAPSSPTSAAAELLSTAPIRLARFLSHLPAGNASRLFILTDSDADGLPAAALLVHALRGSGYTSVHAEVRRKAESAWTPALLDRIRPHAPDALFVLDLGSRPGALLPGVPSLIIDHHAPMGIAPGAELLTGYGTEPTPTTGLLTYWAIAGLVPEETRAKRLWLAAISLLSDLGDKAPFEELRSARSRWSLKSLREVTALLNAPRRSPTGDASAALALLLRASSPDEILSGEHPETAELLRAKDEVTEALAVARKAPPRFSRKFRDELGGDLVAIRMDTPCQVHPLVAQTWRGRFPKCVIMGVNTGFRPGWVHFSARAPKSVNLIGFLREHAPPDADESYGSGHDQASGGALRTATWNRFAAELGFGPELQVEVADDQTE